MAVQEPKKPTQKQKKALSEALAFQKFGIHALRVKTSVLSALGKDAEQYGIKHLGHGKVIVASGNAEEAIARLGNIVDKLAAVEEPNFPLIVDIMTLQREWNAQLISTAQIHLNAVKAATVESPHQMTHTFPAGSPIMIAVGKSQSQA